MTELTPLAEEALICLGIGQRCFHGRQAIWRPIEIELCAQGLAFRESWNREEGIRCYGLTDAGINLFKQLEMKNGRSFAR